MDVDWNALQDGLGLPNRKALAGHLGMNHNTLASVATGRRPLPAKHEEAVRVAVAEAGLNGAHRPTGEPPGEAETIEVRNCADSQRIPHPPTPTAEELDALMEAADAAGIPDPDGAVDHQLIMDRIDEWVGEDPRDPLTLQEFIQELVQAGANDLDMEHLIEGFKRHDWSGLKVKDRERKVSALRGVWREEVRAVREQVRQEQEGDGQRREYSDPNYVMPEEERSALRGELWPRVQELAERSGLLGAAVDLVQRLGVSGEEHVIEFVFLACTSRVFDRPICPLVHGASAGGKTYVSQMTLELFPQEEIKRLNGGSALSLIYDDWSLKHHILCLYEATQIQKNDHSSYADLLRTLISDNIMRWETSVEDPDAPFGRRPETNTNEGPVVVLITTTADSIHPENETRMTRFGVNESATQTKAVMHNIASRVVADHTTTETDAEVEHWRDFQRWIGAGPRVAVIPFMHELVELIPPIAVRLRRDTSSLAALIQAHAILNQAQRDRTAGGAVIATLEDYAAIRPLIARSVAESTGKRPTEAMIKVVEYIQQKAGTVPHAKPESKRGITFSRAPAEVKVSLRALAAELGIDRWAVDRALKAASDAGYIENLENRKGVPGRWVMGERGLEDYDDGGILPTPGDVAAATVAKCRNGTCDS